MKLIFCPDCEDVIKLRKSKKYRRCECGNSGGKYYSDGKKAVITGNAVPLAIDNNKLVDSLEKWIKDGKGQNISAWIFDRDYSGIKNNASIEAARDFVDYIRAAQYDHFQTILVSAFVEDIK